MRFFCKFTSCLFVAFRYLFGRSHKNGRYLLGAAAGIALSLIPIMVTLIVTDGMIRGITDRFLELGTGHIQIRQYRSFAGKEMDINEAARIAVKEKNVRGVWNEIDGIGIILGKNGKTGVSIRAVSPSFWEDEGSRRYLSAIAGEAKIKDDGDVLLGFELAKTLGVEIGKPVRIMTVRTTDSGKTIPRTMVFTLRGLVSSGYHEIDAMWCLISYNAGEHLMKDAGSSFLVIKTTDPYSDIEDTVINLNIKLDGLFHAFTWKQLQPLQYGSYEQTRQILLFIMALIVFVAAVNVSSAVSMLVIERQRDIAVLNAFGTGRYGITAIFILCGLITGVTGSLSGIAVGLFLGIHINQIIYGIEWIFNSLAALVHAGVIKILDPGFYLETIPIIIQWDTVWGIGIFTVVCAVLSSFLPAGRAGKTRPVDLLRKH